MHKKTMLGWFLSALLVLPAAGQTMTSPQQPPSTSPSTSSMNQISHTTQAISYEHRKKSQVDFRATSLEPKVTGKAKVDSHVGRNDINATFHHLSPARNLGPEYLTYVLWAITPDGRPVNLAEVVPDHHGYARVQTSTPLQSFAMVVTAEPYYAVTRPSDMLVAQNIITGKTAGDLQPITANFPVMQKGAYTAGLSPAQLPSTGANPNTPSDLLQARNAVAIARNAGAGQYAPDTLEKAQQFLNEAEQYDRAHQKKQMETVARNAVQTSEDARVTAIQKRQETEAAAQRQHIEQQAQQARTQAQMEAQQRALAQAQSAAEQARMQAEQQQLQAKAEREHLQSQQAQQQVQRAEQEREQMRTKLIQQLNQVVQTRDTARGVVASMPDVLFDFNKATLRPTARERLAKVAGILMAYPDLKLRIEGHTDSIGSPEYNQMLSEKRAETVRNFLASQGVPEQNVSAVGYGESEPIASNATPAGRQRNRRVDVVVSGAAIGTQMAPPGVTPGVPPAATGGVTGTATGAVGTQPAPTTPGTVAAPATQPATPPRQ